MAASGLSCGTWDLCWVLRDLSLQCSGSLAVMHGLNWSPACEIWVPWPWIELVSPALQGRGPVLTTGPPGKSPKGSSDPSHMWLLLGNKTMKVETNWRCIYLYPQVQIVFFGGKIDWHKEWNKKYWNIVKNQWFNTSWYLWGLREVYYWPFTKLASGLHYMVGTHWEEIILSLVLLR